jgi:hypothetical protein
MTDWTVQNVTNQGCRHHTHVDRAVRTDPETTNIEYAASRRHAHHRPFGRITPSMASQPSPHFRVRSFVRFDEITDLAENASDLTRAQHRRPRVTTLLNRRRRIRNLSIRGIPHSALYMRKP